MLSRVHALPRRMTAGTIGVANKSIRFTVKGDLGTGNVLRKEVGWLSTSPA